MLADLGRGVGRLKTQSVMINEETSLHVRLLDDMEGDAERASSGLQTEARHAQKVSHHRVVVRDAEAPPHSNAVGFWCWNR